MFKELVKNNRSYRGFDSSRKLTKEELLELVDLTRYTASSGNMQPLKYHIAYEDEEVSRILALTKWAAALPQLSLPYPGTEPTGFVVICQDMGVNANPTLFLRDIGIAAQTILLAATEKGLGGCMIGNFNKAKMKELLQLPDEVEPNLVVAIGKPAEKIVLTDVLEDGKTAYYRDEDGATHYVPKRSLEDILL